MTDQLPSVKQAQGNPDQAPAPIPAQTPDEAGKSGTLPKLRGRRDTTEKKEPKKLDIPKPEIKDFFKLNPNRENPMQRRIDMEAPIQRYYKDYMSRKMEPILLMDTESGKVDLTTGYQPFRSHAVASEQQAIDAPGVNRKETFTSRMGPTQGEAAGVASGADRVATAESQRAAFVAKQNLAIKADVDKRIVAVDYVRMSMDKEYHEATSIMRTGRTTLYSTILNNNERLNKIAMQSIDSANRSPRSKMSSIQSSVIRSSRYKAAWAGSTMPRTKVSWDNKGRVSSTDHLMLEFGKPTKAQPSEAEKILEASKLYIPESHRTMKGDRRTKAKRKLDPLKEEDFSSKSRDQSKKDKDANVSPYPFGTLVPSTEQNSQTGLNNDSLIVPDFASQPSSGAAKVSGIKIKKKTGLAQASKDKALKEVQFDTKGSNLLTIPPQLKSTMASGQGAIKVEGGEKVRAKPRRKQSFSLTQTKYPDARTLCHPLNDAKGPILNDLATIEKMKKAKRFPVPENLLHLPSDFDLNIDSIMHAAYNSDEMDQWADYKMKCDAPCNSQESNEMIDFESTSEESVRGEIDSEGEAQKSEKLPKVKDEDCIKQVKIEKKKNKVQQQNQLIPDTKEAYAYEKRMRSIKLHKDAIDLHGFDIEILKTYPYKTREGDIPTFLLKDTQNEGFGAIENIPTNTGKGQISKQKQNKFRVCLEKLHKVLDEEFRDKSLLPTEDHIQLLYEVFCKEFNCNPLPVKKYFHDGTLEYKHYSLSLEHVKALVCIIPLLSDLKHIILKNNGLTDEMSTLFIIASYMNPCTTRLTIQQNQVKLAASTTLVDLMNIFPDKIQELNLVGSQQIGNHLDRITKALIVPPEFQNELEIQCAGQALARLDLANIHLSIRICNNLGKFLGSTKGLRTLDLHSCQITANCTRQLLSGLKYNTGLEYFNFSCNDLSSKDYEYSVKVAQIIATHTELMHVDLTNTNLQKEEVIFIGMAIRKSATLLAIHLSCNGLDYYDRIFLRTLVVGKVNYHFRNLAQEKLAGRANRERAQLEALGSGENYDEELTQFLKSFAYIEEQKLNLDEEIGQILQDVDITTVFEHVRVASKQDATTEQLHKGTEHRHIIVELGEKIQRRQALLDSQRQDTKDYHDKHVDLNDPQTIANFKAMGLYNQKADPDEDAAEKPMDVQTVEDKKEQQWLLSHALKIDRIRQRVLLDAEKQVKSKSAGEIALMFTGLGRICDDLLLENPMTGYMNNVIFTRVVGSDEVEDLEVWKDSSQCYACEKWKLQRIEYYDEYKRYMRQNINRLSELDSVLQQCLDRKNEHMLEQVKGIEPKKIVKVDKNMRIILNKVPEGVSPGHGQRSREGSERLETESIESAAEDFEKAAAAEFNPISTVAMDRFKLLQMLPQNHTRVQGISSKGRGGERYESNESSDDEAMQDSDDLPTDGGQATPNQVTRSTFQNRDAGFSGLPRAGAANQTIPTSFGNGALKGREGRNALRPKKESTTGFTGGSYDPEDSGGGADGQAPGDGRLVTTKDVSARAFARAKATGSSAILLAEEPKQARRFAPKVQEREDGSKYRILPKTVYYKGNAFTLDEEVPVDSDEAVSLDTSDDDFSLDEGLVGKVGKRIERNQGTKTAGRELEITQMQKSLEKNSPRKRSIFGRKLIYMCASFNDWVPVEMKSLYELKTARKLDKLAHPLDEFIMKQRRETKGPLQSKQPENNVIQHSQFIPPGRHYLYFIYDRKNIFLSPGHAIVKFKGTNIFLNQIIVTQRGDDELKRFTVEREDTIDETAEFDRSRSVFRIFQEDTAEAAEQMLEKDLRGMRLHRICKSEQRESRKVQDALLKYFIPLKNVFLHAIANSEHYPTLGHDDMTAIAYRSNLFDRSYLNMATFDRIFLVTKSQNTADRWLHRCEFLEFIVRLAQVKYRDSKVCMSLQDAVELIVTKDILPNNPAIDGFKFRSEQLYTQYVDKILKKNKDVLKQLYDGNVDPATKQMRMSDVQSIIKRANLNIIPQRVSACYVESQMSHMDPRKNLTAAKQIRYVEFIIFIGRLAHELYLGSKEEELPLHIKIDRILNPLLGTANLQKIFSFEKQLDNTDEDEFF